jgi:hypothetical protein
MNGAANAGGVFWLFYQSAPGRTRSRARASGSRAEGFERIGFKWEVLSWCHRVEPKKLSSRGCERGSYGRLSVCPAAEEKAPQRYRQALISAASPVD